jgi:predicted GIY-YIG superfamily endonuclease
MYYTYVLKHPRTSLIYVGYTDNLIRRCKEHKNDKPNWRLVYYEGYLSKKDAQRREIRLKNYGSSLGHLRRRISYSLKEVDI